MNETRQCNLSEDLMAIAVSGDSQFLNLARQVLDSVRQFLVLLVHGRLFCVESYLLVHKGMQPLNFWRRVWGDGLRCGSRHANRWC